MTTQNDAAHKEIVIRGVLTSLADVRGAPSIDPGELAVFLEGIPGDWCNGRNVELTPIWQFCVHHNNWSEDHFQRLTFALQQLLSYQSLKFAKPDKEAPLFAGNEPTLAEPQITEAAPQVEAESSLESAPLKVAETSQFEEPPRPEPPRTSEEELEVAFGNLLGDDAGSLLDDSGLEPEERTIVDWVVKSVSKSPIQEVIDPSKLHDFLSSTVRELISGGELHLQMLWEVLGEPEDITKDMLVQAFLLMQVDVPEALSVTVVWPDFLEKLSTSQLLSIYKSYGLEPPAHLEKEQTGNQQAYRTGEQAAYPASRVGSVSPEMAAATLSRTPPSGIQADSRAVTGSFSSQSPELNAARQKAAKKKTKQREKAKANARRKKERDKQARANQRAKEGKEGVSVPAWIVGIVVLLLAGGIGYYLKVRPVSLSGQQMNVRAYSEYLPLHDLRIFGTTVQAMPRSNFYEQAESVQKAKLKLLYTHIKRFNGYVTGMALYNTRGKFIRNYVPEEIPVPQPKKPSERRPLNR